MHSKYRHNIYKRKVNKQIMKRNKMLFKQLLFLYLAQFFTGGNFKRLYDYYTGPENTYKDLIKRRIIPIQSAPEDLEPDIEPTTSNLIEDNRCPPNKSLHSETDIKVMIDYIYDKLSIDDRLKEAYEKQILNMRDIYINDLKHFIEWFQHQPEHLKHVLEGLSHVRTQYIEPKIKSIARVLSYYPDLELQFNEKNVKYQKLEKNLRRYKAMCKFNCEDNEDHQISKRQADKMDYYCSSLEELYDKINQKLNDSTIQMETRITHKLSVESENYKESIDKLQNNLKEKALIAFGRTMYEVLILQDEYHHFVEDLNTTAIEADIYSIQNLNIQLDEKLLQLHRAVETYGRHCRSCGDAVISGVRTFDEDIVDDVTLTIVDSLIDIKFNDTEAHILNEWKQILNGLNELILETEKDTNLDNLKPIQAEIIKLTNTEREELNKLKIKAPRATVNKIMELVKKSQDLLKKIDATIHSIDSLVKTAY